MSRKYKFHNESGAYFISFATVYWLDVFTRQIYFNVLEESIDYCRAVIHEYFHYYLITSESKSKLYHDQLDQFSLSQHPQEILCNTMGETLTKVYLKNN